ncbi:hypothetical protein ACNKHX_02180 [Shigella flexneri]
MALEAMNHAGDIRPEYAGGPQRQ